MNQTETERKLREIAKALKAVERQLKKLIEANRK